MEKAKSALRESTVIVEKKEVVTHAKRRLSEYLDAEVARIKKKYEAKRADLNKREAREISEFLESTCERVKSNEAPPPQACSKSSKWFF